MPVDDLTIKLVRHGESRSNVKQDHVWDVGDANIALTERGHEQAREAGKELGAAFLKDALIYASPYRRTQETLAGILEGAGIEAAKIRVYEDPRLREVEPGYAATNPEQKKEKAPTHGWFYFRYDQGESAADCYDRTSAFMDSMFRQIERKKAKHVLVVTHGLTLRCFVMRYLHLRVADFERMANPKNCAIVTLERNRSGEKGPFCTDRWRCHGVEIAEWVKQG